MSISYVVYDHVSVGNLSRWAELTPNYSLRKHWVWLNNRPLVLWTCYTELDARFHAHAQKYLHTNHGIIKPWFAILTKVHM